MADGTLRDDHCGPADTPTDSGEVPVRDSQPDGVIANASSLPIWKRDVAERYGCLDVSGGRWILQGHPSRGAGRGMASRPGK